MSNGAGRPGTPRYYDKALFFLGRPFFPYIRFLGSSGFLTRPWSGRNPLSFCEARRSKRGTAKGIEIGIESRERGYRELRRLEGKKSEHATPLERTNKDVGPLLLVVSLQCT
jgi:hypothetical protein